MGQALDLAEQWWKAVESGDTDAAMELASPDCEITMPGVGTIDRETMQTQVLPGYHSGFPGFRHEVLDVVDAGDRAVLRLRVTMEHTGPFPTPQGDIPATGRTVVLESCDVVTASNGALTSWHTYFDQLSMLGQLGLLPTPTTS